MGKTIAVAGGVLVGWASLAAVMVWGIVSLDREENELRDSLRYYQSTERA